MSTLQTVFLEEKSRLQRLYELYALEDLKRMIEKRKYIESQIKILKKEMNELEKAVKRHE